jgi:DNA-directed RNA polymerase subunit N (RpoN/RPB10)
LKTMWSEYDLKKMWLIPLIEEYIEKIRQESYDGYMSLEPTTIDEVGIDDYCTIRAILQKEWVYDCMAESLQDFVDEWYSELVRQNASPMYKVKVPNGKKRTNYNWDVVDDYDIKDYALDFDTKTLIPMEK